MSKAKKVTTIVVASLFVVISIFMLVWYFGDSYGQFYAVANKEFEIEGLDEGYTPQGLCYESKSQTFLSSGYMKNGSASRIYVVDAATYKTVKYFTLSDETEVYTGHAGGIATDGVNVWLVGDGNVHRFSYADIQTVECGKSIEIIDSFKSNNNADFVTIEEEFLWVGEFHKDGKYDTDETHHIQTSDGKTNKALSFCYQIDENSPYAVASTTPIKALSTKSLVQGMIITSNKIVLSTSYSLPNSHIYTYKNIFDSTNMTYSYDGTDVPLFVLEDKDLISDLEAPCMSEEIALAKGRVFILFESACQKYNMVTRESLRHTYSYYI